MYIKEVVLPWCRLLCIFPFSNHSLDLVIPPSQVLLYYITINQSSCLENKSLEVRYVLFQCFHARLLMSVSGILGGVGKAVGGVTDTAGKTVSGVTDTAGNAVGGVGKGLGDTAGGATKGLGDTTKGSFYLLNRYRAKKLTSSKASETQSTAPQRAFRTLLLAQLEELPKPVDLAVLTTLA